MIALRFRKYIWLYSRVCIWLVFRVRIMITRVPCAVLSGVGTIGCGGFDSSDVPPVPSNYYVYKYNSYRINTSIVP